MIAHLEVIGVVLVATLVVQVRSKFESINAPPRLLQHMAAKRNNTLDCECGRSNAALKQRIVGGNNTLPHEFPWQVAIIDEDDGIYCGGSIISDRHILTAGHCVYYTDPHELYVLVGMHDLRLRDGVRYNISDVRLHPAFQSLEQYDLVDVAVIITHRPIRFGATVLPVCLPLSTGETYVGRRTTVAGWGRVIDEGPAADLLQAARVIVLSTEDCLRTPMGALLRPEVMMCAYARSMDACQGDSGGPMVVATTFNRFEQLGIVSFGASCGTPDMPGIYVPVTYALPWLRKVLSAAKVCRDPAVLLNQ